MSEQDFLIAQWKVLDDPGTDHRLGGLQGVGVLQRVFLERHRRQLLGQSFPRVSGGHEIQRGLEDVFVNRRRPVVIGQIPARLPDQQHEVRKEQERIDAPLLGFGRVDAGRQFLEVGDRGGAVPRTEQAAAQHPVHRLDHLQVRGRRLAAPNRDHRVRARQLVMQGLEPVLHDLGGFLFGVLPLMQHRGVVELGERVDEQLPVAADFGSVGIDLGHFVEGIALQALGHRTQVFGQRCCGRVEVDEDEAFPYLATHRLEAVLALVDVEELILLLNEGQFAVETVAPSVVFAGELPAGAGGLLMRKVVPHQLVAPMPADVVEGPDHAVLALDDDHRHPRSGGRQLLGEVATSAGEAFDAADVEPGAPKDRPLFVGKVLRVDGVRVVDRRGAQLRIVLRPAPGSRFGEVRQGPATSLRDLVPALRAARQKC